MNIETIKSRCEAAIKNFYGTADGCNHKITDKPFEIDDGLTWCWVIIGCGEGAIIINEPSRDTTLRFDYHTGALTPYDWSFI